MRETHSVKGDRTETSRDAQGTDLCLFSVTHALWACVYISAHVHIHVCAHVSHFPWEPSVSESPAVLGCVHLLIHHWLPVGCRAVGISEHGPSWRCLLIHRKSIQRNTRAVQRCETESCIRGRLYTSSIPGGQGRSLRR